jgi:hypothetical protein
MCRNTKVVKLTIGDQTWEAISYRWGNYNRLYVVGELPKDWSRANKHQFALEGSEWSIISFLDTFEEMSEMVQSHHPFGNHWIMEKWTGHVSLPYPIKEATVE